MSENSDRAATSVRTMEIAVALFVFVCGAVVVIDSIRLGAKWAEDGPQAGYFPFYIGMILCISSAVTCVSSFLRKELAAKVFVTRGQLKLVLSVLVPLMIYVALIKFLGIYVASLVFIGWFMLQLGHYSWWVTAIVAFATMLVFFLMFEVWFKVPLPKGPVENLLGLA